MPLSILRVGLEFAKSQSAGQSHLNSDATIAYEGRPQGAPLPIVFSRRSALGRAPRGVPLPLGVRPWGGHPQGAPLPIVFSRRFALRRAPTRGAPTGLLSAFCPGKGTHKGCPYRLSSLGVRPWGGHPQGAPLPIVFSRRFALGRAPTRGAPTGCLLSAFGPGEGTHKGCPYLSAFGPGEGTHKGCPYLSAFGPGKGTHKGCPYLSAFGPGEGTHKGRPYLSAFCPGEGTHGVPLGVTSRRSALGRAPTPLPLGVRPWGGHPQGAPLPDSSSLTRFILI